MDFIFPDIIFTILGIAGVIGYLVAYVMLQLKREFAKSTLYSLMNMISAVLMMFSLFSQFNIATLLINLAWFFISAYGIYRCMKYKHNEIL